jgi:hypothetical protein
VRFSVLLLWRAACDGIHDTTSKKNYLPFLIICHNVLRFHKVKYTSYRKNVEESCSLYFNTSTMALGLTQPLIEMSTRNFLASKALLVVRLTTVLPSVSILSRQRGILDFSQPYRPPLPYCVPSFPYCRYGDFQ